MLNMFHSIPLGDGDCCCQQRVGDGPCLREEVTLHIMLDAKSLANQQQIAVPIFNSGHPSCVRVLDSDEYRKEFLGFHFDREEVCDEDLFNPAVYPVSAADHEELAAAESFNWEMAELEALEHQEELRSLFQARITAVRQGSSGKQRPAKISSLNNAMFSGLPRGAPSSGLKGKRFNPAKKCPHNINQPLQTGRYY